MGDGGRRAVGPERGVGLARDSASLAPAPRSRPHADTVDEGTVLASQVLQPREPPVAVSPQGDVGPAQQAIRDRPVVGALSPTPRIRPSRMGIRRRSLAAAGLRTTRNARRGASPPARRIVSSVLVPSS